MAKARYWSLRCCLPRGLWGRDRFFILDLLPTKNVYAIEVEVELQLGRNSSVDSSQHAVLKKLERFRELESLEIKCDLEKFQYPNLPWLKRVDFDWVDDDDGRAKDWLASMPNLECLWVDGEDLESSCLKHLPTSIRRLHVCAQSEQIDLSSLSRLTQLEHLSGYANARGKTKITAVAKLPNLKQLFLQRYEWIDGEPELETFQR